MSIQKLKQLKAQTGASFSHCKQALEQSSSYDQAVALAVELKLAQERAEEEEEAQQHQQKVAHIKDSSPHLFWSKEEHENRRKAAQEAAKAAKAEHLRQQADTRRAIASEFASFHSIALSDAIEVLGQCGDKQRATKVLEFVLRSQGNLAEGWAESFFQRVSIEHGDHHCYDSFESNWFRVTDPETLKELVELTALANPRSEEPFTLEERQIHTETTLGETVYRIRAVGVRAGYFGWRDGNGELQSLDELVVPLLVQGEVIRVRYEARTNQQLSASSWVSLMTWDGRSAHAELSDSAHLELCEALGIDWRLADSRYSELRNWS